MSDLERQLRDMFHDRETQAPAARPVSEYLGDQPVKSSRRWQFLAVPAAVVVTAAVVVGVAALSVSSPSRQPAAGPSVSGIRGEGPVWDSATADCDWPYAVEYVPKKDFAFDGTVTAIGPAQSGGPGDDRYLSAVTFTVNEWFLGGTAPSLTVDMPKPQESGSGAYGTGTRLLVAGGPRWGGPDPTADAFAGGACGYVVYWDAQTADAWRAASIATGDSNQEETSYPTNASGQTYGNLPNSGEGMRTEDIPDLIGVKGNSGLYGYITKHAFLGGPPPANPSQALENQATASPVTVPVYASDGVTIIDYFTIGVGEPVTELNQP